VVTGLNPIKQSQPSLLIIGKPPSFAFGEVELTRRTSFANYLDPSEGLALPNATAWPSYGGDNERNMLRLLGGNVTVFSDTYRPQMEYFTTEPEAFNQRKRAVGA
jgi:hypothetical protein